MLPEEEPCPSIERRTVQTNKVVFVNIKKNKKQKLPNTVKALQTEETSDCEEPVFIKQNKNQRIDNQSPSLTEKDPD